MSWSIPIAKVFGIPVRVHLTFLLVVAWGAAGWGTRHGWYGAIFGVILTLLVFASVALHELGHSVVAQRRGLGVLDIVLLPIGGVATLDGKPKRPIDELWIALAGPAVNLVLALGLGALALGLGTTGLLDVEAVRSLRPSWSTLLGLLVAGNLTLALFNLLPIFPMDGGRVLRALLATRFGMERGTRWAAGVGQLGAVAMGSYAVLSGAWLLALVAVMVFFAAGRERLDVTARGALRELTARSVARVPSVLLHPTESTAGALARTLQSTDEVFPVVVGEQLLGSVTRPELMQAVRVGLGEQPLTVLPLGAWVEVGLEDSLESVLERLERERASLAVVLEEAVPVGLISREHLYAQVLPASAALARRQGDPAHRTGQPASRWCYNARHMEWLNYHHLYYFWLSAKEGGVGRAAKKLRLAQPTLSSQIRALGASLGGELFERRGRALVLTELGTMVYRHAEEIFGIGQDLLDAAKGRSTGRMQRLVVGISDVLPKLAVYRMLEPAFQLQERVRVICREDTSERLVTALGNHALDMVLSDCPLSPGSGTKAFNHLLGESSVTVFAAPALASQLKRGFPKSLDGAPFIMPSEHSALRRELSGWFDAHDLRPLVWAETDDSALAKVFGQAGVGAFVAPTAIEGEVARQYSVRPVGRIPALKERYFAISLERRIRHPGVLAICSAARELLSA